MKLQPGSSTFDQARTVGQYLCALVDDPTWLRRRVETVQVVDLKRVERRITLDVDMSRVREKAKQAGIRLKGLRKLPVPLALLQKTLLLDIDVRSQDGGSLTMATSHEDSGAAHAMMLFRITKHLPGVVSSVSPLVLERMYAIAKEMPSQADYDTLMDGEGQDKQVLAWRLPNTATVTDRAVWGTMLRNDEVKTTIADFTRLFMPTVYLDMNSRVTLVKYRYVERESIMPRQSTAERLCWKSSPTLIEAPAASRAEREHLRLIAPPGLSVTDLWLARISNGSHTQSPSPGRPTFQYRVALERGVLYSTGLQRGTYMAIGSLMPNATEFALPALIATSISALMLLGGAWYQHASAVLEDAQSTIALLLLAPSTVAAYLTRRGEHQLLGRLLRWPRILVGLTAVGSLLAAGSIVLQRQDPPEGVEPFISAGAVVATWGLSGAYAAAVTLILAVAAYRGSYEKRQVSESPLASETPVHQLPPVHQLRRQ